MNCRWGCMLNNNAGTSFLLHLTEDAKNLNRFLSCCKIPKHLPVTIACHDSVKCWSSETESRTSSPYSDYSNLILVYPQFPEEIAFGKDRKNRGVGCHHPKLIALQRKDSIRIIVTSANLVSRQWNTITNTVWFQDFHA